MLMHAIKRCHKCYHQQDKAADEIPAAPQMAPCSRQSQSRRVAGLTCLAYLEMADQQQTSGSAVKHLSFCGAGQVAPPALLGYR